MSFTKITSEDLADKGVVGLPDTPNLSVTALQKKFDEIATDVIVPKFNGLVDELDAFEEGVDITQRVKSSEITNIRTDEDENLQISRDNGKTWSATASSGHIIEDGNGTPYPSRGRMQFSANVNIFDEPDDNRTFIQVQSGEKGEPGDSATISVGNVTSSGTDVSVTNVGSDNDAIFDFVLPKGDSGQAATVQVGTVTSGTNASVLNRGTSSNAIFDFVLPKGDKGDAGTSFKVLGMYPTYADLIAAHPVGNKGDAYAVGTSTLNEIYNWNNDTRMWDNLGSLQGAKGDPGNAATVTVGTVTTLLPTDQATVQNDGTTENAIFSFGIPKGDKGDQGNAATIAIGNVTKGETPTVTNVGTPTNAIFDITLPKGDKGDPTTVNGKSGETIQLTGADIQLIGYRPGSKGEIDPSDNLNVAISKLVASSGGAKIIVTADSDSIGNTMTCTKGDMVYEAVVDASEKASFVVSDIGTWTIKNVQTERETTVNVPYFGVYNVALGIGDIQIVVTYDAEYVGATFTAKNGSVTKSLVADSSLTMTFVLADYGTWTIENTHDDKTKTVNAPEGGTYNVSFDVAAYDYQGWLDSASITTSYASLDEVLADENALRVLFTKHASVDYLVEWVDNGDAYTPSKNRIDKNKLSHTSYSGTDGTPSYTDTITSTSKIAVEPNSQYTFSGISGNTYRYLEWNGSTYVGTNTFSNSATITTSATTTLIVFQCLNAGFDGNVQLEKGQTATPYEPYTPSILENILGNDLCAKWINLRDYALDTLLNSTTCKGVMDSVDKYGYGEWVNNNGTWQPKGNVPIMTSNTAPYGEVSGTAERDSSYLHFQAFDGNDSTQYGGNVRANVGNSGSGYIQYKFTNPICVKRTYIKGISTIPFTSIKVEISNDDSNYTEIATNTTISADGYIDTPNNNDYALYVRVSVTQRNDTSSSVYVPRIYTLQFYGRELSVSVPTMTSNTAPWGEAIGSGANSYTSNYQYYHAFIRDTTKFWAQDGNKEGWIGYDFGTPIVCKFFRFNPLSATASYNYTYKIQGSEDKTEWFDITETKSFSTSSAVKYNNENSANVICTEFITNKPFRYLRYKQESTTGENSNAGMLQFYGLDYSEHTERHYIYDHGVEVETLTGQSNNADSKYEKRADELYLSTSPSQRIAQFYTADIDMTPYKLIRVVSGNENLANANGYSAVITATKEKPMGYTQTSVAKGYVETSKLPYNNYLDIANVNESCSANVAVANNTTSANRVATIVEWWLE